MAKEWGRYNVNVNAWRSVSSRPASPSRSRRQQKTIDVAGRDIKVGVKPQMLDAMAR